MNDFARPRKGEYSPSALPRGKVARNTSRVNRVVDTCALDSLARLAEHAARFGGEAR